MAISPLRSPSSRPELVVDEHPARVVGPVTQTELGFAGPLGRDRVQTVLPLYGGPVLLDPARLLRDASFSYVADVSGFVIGEHGAVWVGRMLTATVAGNSRRL